jgi:acid stress-induced BolA-like protein IbaG/YrbA
MSHHDTRLSLESTFEQLKSSIAAALPGADIHVEGGGGHFTISVVSEAFEGKNTLGRQRLVYSAITALMAGDDAPVHAVDKLTTKTPNE